MADDLKNINTISKKGTGFPGYLDFKKLRSEGIEYLGKLSGQIWTDHNVHDPGITILEMLCYALLDLGYRTNLPEADILARNPAEVGKDNNFFTPAQILTGNPLTITDFRKMLVDIREVRNSWLETATDVTDICRPSRKPDGSNQPEGEMGCESFLNGLYHVYLDLEKDIDRDFETGEQADSYRDAVISNVKKALMAHRNLCEDFLDVHILCKLPLGVCAAIELEESASPEKVYIRIVEDLRNFFTPSPRFYTLQQLLDKKKPIEDIFAGRPYDIAESHGFVDTAEFEKLELKKEIHLSDVYNVIFRVTGVRSIRNLSLRTCDDSNLWTQWKFPIPKDHIAEFSIRCSGFQFARNGIPISADLKKHDGFLTLNFNHTGKVQYKMPSPYLDGDIPTGHFRNDLATYYSIQNEFPRVYGIEEGGLPDDASDLRQAQALQLKGFLFFFDQMLANYLAQLKSIRALFALSSPADAEKQHTYFINQLNSVPELQKLLRFQVDEAGENPDLGSQGSTLVFPVDKGALLSLQQSDRLKYLDLEEIRAYSYSSIAAQDIAIGQLKNDLYHQAFTLNLVTKTDGCVYYYILSSSEEIALISKKYFKDLKSAKLSAASVAYIGTFVENYRSFVDNDQNFSFTIELNLASYARYLQLVVENRPLYLQRRQDFLRHLSARFAEKFTDYALLSFSAFNDLRVEEAKINAAERFLTSYDEVGGKRGKAYDYLASRWVSDNISGFEKRVKLLSGMDCLNRRSLCNFIVNRYDARYAVKLTMAGQHLFEVKAKYDTPQEAKEGAMVLYRMLSDRLKYRTEYLPHEERYAIVIGDGKDDGAIFRDHFLSADEANTAIDRLHQLFAGNPAADENIFVSRFIYSLELRDSQGDVVRSSLKSYDTQANAQLAANQIRKGINDEKRWQQGKDRNSIPGTLYRLPHATAYPQFIDLDVFKTEIHSNIVGKPDKCTYEVLDVNNRFKFSPAREFDNEKQAQDHCQGLLLRLTDAGTYRILKSDISETYTLVIHGGGEVEAVCEGVFRSEREAAQMQNKVISVIRQYQYTLAIREEAHRRRFIYQLGAGPNEEYTFESVDEFDSEEDTLAAADIFFQSISHVQLRKYKGELRLVPIKTGERVSSVRLVRAHEGAELGLLRKSINHWLAIEREAKQLREGAGAEVFEAMVSLDGPSQQGLFVYRLVDKDTVPARYSQTFKDDHSAENHMKQLVKIQCGDYRYLEICLGGNIISRRKDARTGSTWYHFLIKSRNRFHQSGEELVLFESTRGYQTEEEALTAFSDSYLQILHWGSDVNNYGSIISIEEILIHTTDPPINNERIVFVPKQTLIELDGYDEASVKALAALASTYPIRLVGRQSEEFHALFPCDDKPGSAKEKSCKAEEQAYVYYFRLHHAPGNPDDPYWQSTKYHADIEDTRRDFGYFLMLLCYPGNFFTDCDDCPKDVKEYRIYIREVLAESTRRFASIEDAWGKEGVQKFICASQTPGAFHNYQSREDCCYTFYVACPDGLVYHPCRYDTPQKRDAAIDRLYRGIDRQYKTKAFQFIPDEKKEVYIMLNGHGELFARAIVKDRENICETLLKFLGKVTDKQIGLNVNEDGTLYMDDEESGFSVIAYEGNEAEGWLKTLEAFACNYPVVRRTDPKTGRNEYCVEIKLPGFNYCDESGGQDVPCRCEDRADQKDPACDIAWKSRCCFNSCEEAFEAWRTIMTLLLQYDNYRPLFDCNCYDFSIGLHYHIKEEVPGIYNRAVNFSLADGEMLALNPQCYSSPEMVCSAVERSRDLINCEGLHVVEHILLRPRCVEDCECRQYHDHCDSDTNCSFTWNAPDDDPCADQPNVCFTPGSDPYSFIATVALPAWPDRFRKAGNRQIMENILYREAPAHVLLRILWLAPHDFCCFENKHKGWVRWLAGKNQCGLAFSNCEFLELLFDQIYECLPECDDCKPCREDEREGQDCFDTNEETSLTPIRFIDQVNSIYCWKEQDCDGYTFVSCEEAPVVGVPGAISDVSSSHALTSASDVKIAISKDHPTPGKKPGVALALAKTGKSSAQIIAPADKRRASQVKPKPQWVNSRLTQYRMTVNGVFEAGAHPLAEKVLVFLKDPDPSGVRVSDLLMEIAQHAKTEEGLKLTKKQKFELLQSVLCYYLDKICIDNENKSKITALAPVAGQLTKLKTNVNGMFRYWNAREVKSYEPALDTDELARILNVKEQT